MMVFGTLHPAMTVLRPFMDTARTAPAGSCRVTISVLPLSSRFRLRSSVSAVRSNSTRRPRSWLMLTARSASSRWSIDIPSWISGSSRVSYSRRIFASSIFTVIPAPISASRRIRPSGPASMALTMRPRISCKVSVLP